MWMLILKISCLWQCHTVGTTSGKVENLNNGNDPFYMLYEYDFSIIYSYNIQFFPSYNIKEIYIFDRLG